MNAFSVGWDEEAEIGAMVGLLYIRARCRARSINVGSQYHGIREAYSSLSPSSGL